MPREFTRSTRVAEQLRREIGSLMRFGVKDPRAQNATVTDVEVSKDVSYARVYFSVLDDDAEKIRETERALNHAAGYLRRELGQVLRMRHVPELRFTYDSSIAEGARMDALIEAARRRDRESGADVEDADNNGGDAE